MKPIWMLGLIAAMVPCALAQRPGCDGLKVGQTATASAQADAPAAAKRPPQAKTKPELNDFNTANAVAEVVAADKAAADFAVKYPASELRLLLYKSVMNKASQGGDSDKAETLGRKVLELDADDPDALIDVATSMVQLSHEGDIDFDDRMVEAAKLATRATETIDTDVAAPASATPAQVAGYKSYLRSSAWGILGAISFNQKKFAVAEQQLRKSIAAYPEQVDAVAVLRLSLALDNQNKYVEALAEVNKVVAMAPAGDPVGDTARKEQSRLDQLVNKKK